MRSTHSLGGNTHTHTHTAWPHLSMHSGSSATPAHTTTLWRAAKKLAAPSQRSASADSVSPMMIRYTTQLPHRSASMCAHWPG